ncbi:hypothetical protein ACFXDP_07815, partial [Streptomyces sp. NPDC059374]
FVTPPGGAPPAPGRAPRAPPRGPPRRGGRPPHRRRLLAPARMMGSVTQAVLLHAASPVAVVPPASAEE